MRPDPLRPHRHDPNPMPPSADPGFELREPLGRTHWITLEQLAALPQTRLPECYIVSTGHGTSGPFTFGGPRLWLLLEQMLPARTQWQQVEVISGDGFGTRLSRAEVFEETRPIILAITLEGQNLPRALGLVRLIVPHEVDDALRQVKWVRYINVLTDEFQAS